MQDIPRYVYLMNKFISEDEFNALMMDRRAGNTTLSISKTVARQFFTHVGRNSVQETTGESITFKKLLIWTGVILAPALFVLFMVSVYFQYSPVSASFIIPAAGIFWAIIFGLTSNHGGWLAGSIPLFLSLLLLFTTQATYGVPLTLLVLSIWLQRSTYLLAGQWLEEIIARSYAAYEMLVEHIEITTTK